MFRPPSKAILCLRVRGRPGCRHPTSCVALPESAHHRRHNRAVDATVRPCKTIYAGIAAQLFLPIAIAFCATTSPNRPNLLFAAVMIPFLLCASGILAMPQGWVRLRFYCLWTSHLRCLLWMYQERAASHQESCATFSCVARRRFCCSDFDVHDSHPYRAVAVTVAVKSRSLLLSA